MGNLPAASDKRYSGAADIYKRRVRAERYEPGDGHSALSSTGVLRITMGLEGFEKLRTYI